MANGFNAKDFSGSAVEVLSKEVAHTGLGITGQEQVNLIADGVAGQNLLTVDASGAAKVVQKNSSSAATANVAASVSSVALIAANTARVGATIFNDSASTMYVNLGAAASLTVFVIKLPSQSYYQIPFNYTGAVNGIWDTATGTARVCEFS